MPYPANFYKLQVSGEGYSGEIWSWGLSIVPNFEGTPTHLDTVPQGVLDAISTFHTAMGMASTQAVLKTVKLNLVGPDGRYVSEGNTVFHEFDPGLAGASAVYPPAQIALAVTLNTPVARGRASRGRFYMPYPAITNDGTGFIPTGDATTVAQRAADMLTAINAAMPTGDVGVASGIGEGAFQPVTSVTVGRVLDTQRRRRNALAEQYVPGVTVDVAEPGG